MMAAYGSKETMTEESVDTFADLLVFLAKNKVTFQDDDDFGESRDALKIKNGGIESKSKDELIDLARRQLLEKNGNIGMFVGVPVNIDFTIRSIRNKIYTDRYARGLSVKQKPALQAIVESDEFGYMAGLFENHRVAGVTVGHFFAPTATNKSS